MKKTKSTLPKLGPGKFSPTRFKTLQSCKWQYNLKYIKSIYPVEQVIEPHSQLGSAMHYFAENYKTKPDGSINESLISLLTQRAKEPDRYVLTSAQMVELDHMIHTLTHNIWPSLEGNDPSDPFEVDTVEVEKTVTGAVAFNDTEGLPVQFNLNMKIDRFIKTKDGRVIIVDYKKGAATMSKHMFQLLFYATTYAQRNRIAIENIHIWLVFPNEANNWIHKLEGRDIVDEIPSFEEEMATLVTESQTAQTEGYTEMEAQPSFLCNFCPYQATPFCPTSLMLHGPQNPENASREFAVSSFSYGKRVLTKVDPKKVVSSSSSW